MEGEGDRQKEGDRERKMKTYRGKKKGIESKVKKGRIEGGLERKMGD